jgi:HSP20 family protein
MKMIKHNRPMPANFLRYFDDHATQARDAAYRPAVNIAETDEAFELALLAPGRAKDNFNIAFNEGTLEITYTTPTTEIKEGDSTPADRHFRRQEFKLIDFSRRFQLDAQVINVDAIDASYTDGILRLALPKREEALPKVPRKIAVA